MQQNLRLHSENTMSRAGPWQAALRYVCVASLSPLVRLQVERWGNIHGADSDLNPMMVPTADPTLRGGNRAVVVGGVEFYIAGGTLQGNRFAIEVGVPVHQSLRGPQLEESWSLWSGWSWTY